MDAIEKRARELLASTLDMSVDYLSRYGDMPNMTTYAAALPAIIAALAPPAGYVLVPAVLPEKMLDALYCAEGDMSDGDMQKLWQQLLAARPEVP